MTDQDTTHQMPPAEPPTDPQRPRRLTRSRSDRMLGGVAGGLGEYFGVDSLIFRIGFAVSVFFGGLGALAYLVLYLFVPSERSDGTVGRPPIQRSRLLAAAGVLGIFILLGSWGIFDGDPWGDGGPFFLGGPLVVIAVVAALFYLLRRDEGERTPRGILATVAIALAAAIALLCLAALAAWAGATGSGEVVAAVIISIGVLLVIAAFRGGARWLIVPALALALPLGAVAAADVSFDGGVGDREYEPATVAAIPADGYELGAGRLAVDLRSLDWGDDSVVHLPTDLGMGETVVAVPETVCVTGTANASIGAVEIAGDEDGGIDVEGTPNAGSEATPRLELDATVDLGAIRVVNDDDAEIDDHDRGPFDHDRGDRDEMREAMAAACAPDPEPARAGSGKEDR